MITAQEIGNLLLNIPTASRDWLVKHPLGAQVLVYTMQVYPDMKRRKDAVERLIEGENTGEYFRSLKFYCAIHSIPDNEFRNFLTSLEL